jgi:hypothetical protein
MKVRMEDEMDVKSGRGPGSANRGVFRRDDAHLWGSKQIGKPCFVASSRRRVRYTCLLLPSPLKLLCCIRHRIHSLTLLCRFALVAS